MKKVSIYTQGGIQSAVFRYRFLQYFEKLECEVLYNKSLSDKQYHQLMPIGERGTVIKIFAFIIMYLRTLFYLFRDLFITPDYIVIARTIQKKMIPITYKVILKGIKRKGCVIIWDFDDDILELKEINYKDFEFLSAISQHIIIASSYLKHIIQSKYHNKLNVLPTTDGTMQPKFSTSVINSREERYIDYINVIWVGTSSGLQHLEQIVPQIDKAGNLLLRMGKVLRFVIICNRDLECVCAHVKLINRKWSISVAEEEFLNAHIGLMPLDNSNVSQGKGGFKLIQYMSVGLPSLASAVGINNQILEGGGGFLIDDLKSEEWCNKIVALATDANLWKRCSKKAIYTYLTKYNYQDNLNTWSSIVDCNIKI